MTEEITTLKLTELVAKYSSYPVEEVCFDTRIGEDLRIIGDDASEFLEEFSNSFGVDLSSMNFDDYFPSEASSDMHYYLGSIAKNKSKNRLLILVRSIESKFWGCFARKKSFKTITVQNLIDAIERKKW